MESLNIVNLIEKTSITRLSKDYENRFLSKIKENFNENQQQLFVSSFYCYLNYDSKKDFVIDFDHIWKWLGFSRKDPAKRLLEKHFVVDTDYKIEKVAPPIGGAAQNDPKNLGGAGLNKEKIMLTVNAFKKFCLKSGTNKADEVHDYYIKLEELLHETVNEESNELRKQLLYKEEENKKLEEKHFKLQENHKRIIYKNSRHKLKIGECLYLIRNPDIDETKNMTKLGTTKNLNIRRTSYITYFDPEILYVIFTNSNKILEDILKLKYKENIKNSSDEWIIGIDIEEIISFIEIQSNLLNINFTSHRNISEIEEEKTDVDKVEEKTDVDKEDMKKCSKCLIERNKNDTFNKDKTKKDGFHTLCKVCEKENKVKYTKYHQCITPGNTTSFHRYYRHIYTNQASVVGVEAQPYLRDN